MLEFGFVLFIVCASIILSRKLNGLPRLWVVTRILHLLACHPVAFEGTFLRLGIISLDARQNTRVVGRWIGRFGTRRLFIRVRAIPTTTILQRLGVCVTLALCFRV